MILIFLMVISQMNLIYLCILQKNLYAISTLMHLKGIPMLEGNHVEYI